MVLEQGSPSTFMHAATIWRTELFHWLDSKAELELILSWLVGGSEIKDVDGWATRSQVGNHSGGAKEYITAQ